MHTTNEYFVFHEGNIIAGPFLVKDVAWQWLRENTYKFQTEDQANYWKYSINEQGEDE
tara:strand:+ start:13 stop:186 length:174 start_codon:yes stop_codon:yes gene_type:complete